MWYGWCLMTMKITADKDNNLYIRWVSNASANSEIFLTKIVADK